MTLLIPPTLSHKFIARFWSRVKKGAPDECWPWQRCTLKNGYGQVCHKKRGFMTHRIALFLTTGEWPEVTMHTCDNRPCCNPAHLVAGTVALNNLDARLKGHCQRGDDHWTRRIPEKVIRGERHKRARFSDSQVEEIRRLLKSGMTQVEVAARFGTTQPRISEYHLGKTRRSPTSYLRK